MSKFEDGDLVKAVVQDEDHPDVGELGVVLVAEDANGSVHVEWSDRGVEFEAPEDLVLVERRPALQVGDMVRSIEGGVFGTVVAPLDANGDVQIDWGRNGISLARPESLLLVRRR
jgi:hypothetical protein